MAAQSELIRRLTKDNEKLLKHNRELLGENAALTKANEELTKENEKLMRENGELKPANIRLENALCDAQAIIVCNRYVRPKGAQKVFFVPRNVKG